MMVYQFRRKRLPRASDLARYRDSLKIRPEFCDCGHAWKDHARQENGAYACKDFGCGCRDVIPPAEEGTR